MAHLEVSGPTLAFILVVSQGGEGDIFHQLLKLLIAGDKVCLAVDLRRKH